jgi:hypothetical protein
MAFAVCIFRRARSRASFVGVFALRRVLHLAALQLKNALYHPRARALALGDANTGPMANLVLKAEVPGRSKVCVKKTRRPTRATSLVSARAHTGLRARRALRNRALVCNNTRAIGMET